MEENKSSFVKGLKAESETCPDVLYTLMKNTPMLETVEELLPEDMRQKLCKLQQDAGVAYAPPYSADIGGVAGELKKNFEPVTNARINRVLSTTIETIDSEIVSDKYGNLRNALQILHDDLIEKGLSNLQNSQVKI